MVNKFNYSPKLPKSLSFDVVVEDSFPLNLDLATIDIMLPDNHSEVPMKENPTNIPIVPPTVPTLETNVLMRYSVLTVLWRCSDLKPLFVLGNRNVYSMTNKVLFSKLYGSLLWLFLTSNSFVLHVFLQCSPWSDFNLCRTS